MTTIHVRCPICSAQADLAPCMCLLVVTDDPAMRRVEFICADCDAVSARGVPSDQMLMQLVSVRVPFQRHFDRGGDVHADQLVRIGQMVKESDE